VAERRSIHNVIDLERLPRWAQDDIAALVRDVDRMKRELAAGPEDSDTFVDGGWPESPDRPLGKRPTIKVEDKKGNVIIVSMPPKMG
jgi:hypothetical protein